MPAFGDNPFDDGLDFVGCPPQPTKLILPEFPKDLKQDCKLICWGRCLPVPDGERRMIVAVDGFEPDPNECGVYHGEAHFVDAATGDEWYRGELRFYYTRNYLYPGMSIHGERQRSVAFRFVVKGDIVRVSDQMPEWECLILCTKQEEAEEKGVPSYDEIFVYGGLDILYDVEHNEMMGFIFSLGHNDGWYTHHPKCSARPIDWSGLGDYIGHYCDRGWLFVSPGRNFVFDPGIRPPTGRFFEEALRVVGRRCYTEEAMRYGAFDLTHKRCIHSYQMLRGVTECRTSLSSAEFCQGLVYSDRRAPWITFFSMGYWMDYYQRRRQILHLAEGNIRVNRDEFEKYEHGLYFYGFATQHEREERKLVDLASNKDVIGMPVDTRLLVYLYNAGRMVRDPKVREPVPIDPKLAAELLRKEIVTGRDRAICLFLERAEGPKDAGE